MEVKNKVRQYIVENFLYGEDNGLKDKDSFIDEGIVDSTGIIEILTFVEDEFNLEVADDEISRENFDSVGNLTNFIETKIAQA